MATRKPILVVAGVGTGAGTGAATARLFAKTGYNIALIARNTVSLQTLAEEIKATGADAAAFPVAQYDYKEIHDAFDAIKKHWPNDEIRVTVWNATHGVRKPFLEITEEDIKESVQVNIVAAFAFARESILVFKDLPLNDIGARGNFIVTSATAAWRGNLTTSAFAAGKHGLKALAQSLNKEFGKQNIHVSHAIIDGPILTDRLLARPGAEELAKNVDARLDPNSIAKAYLYLAQQDRTAWTFELDLRSAHEKW